MKIDRTQHLLTRSINDVIALTNDDVAYSKVCIEDIECGREGGWAHRAEFHEGGYEDSVSKFNVAPYLSGYTCLGTQRCSSTRRCSFWPKLAPRYYTRAPRYYTWTVTEGSRLRK
eukprot:944874-Pleurochrysis_carterae.AAC.1